MIDRDGELWHWQGQRLICRLLEGIPHGFGSALSYPARPPQLAQQWWQGQRAVWAEQVHGDHLREAGDPQLQADALYTCTPGTSVWVSTADCVPVLLAGPGVVAAIHAGWRGTAAQITAKVIRHLGQRLGIAPQQWLVAIGPCIAAAAYQVSQAVAEQVAATLPVSYAEQVVLPDPQPDKARLDLALANAYQALAAGATTIAISPHCTYQEPERFFSYRRLGSLRDGDRPSYLQWSGIALPGSPAA
ncbi:MAG: peptidoglycan editing factor PgeF [Thermostichales cyanobacterium SZTDM-1c_bins_54]